MTPNTPRPLAPGDVLYAFADLPGTFHPEVVFSVNDDGTFEYVVVHPASSLPLTHTESSVRWGRNRIRLGDDAVVGPNGVVLPPLKPAYPGLLFETSEGRGKVVGHVSAVGLTVVDTANGYVHTFEKGRRYPGSPTLDGLRAAGYAPLWEVTVELTDEEAEAVRRFSGLHDRGTAPLGPQTSTLCKLGRAIPAPPTVGETYRFLDRDREFVLRVYEPDLVVVSYLTPSGNTFVDWWTPQVESGSSGLPFPLPWA